jgi:hypothetical protein
MKRTMHLSLLACSVVTMSAAVIAEQPAKSAAPSTAGSTAPDGQQWLGNYKWPYGSLYTGKRAAVLNPEVRFVPPPYSRSTCYFIQTLRPVPGDTDAKRSGFIPLQTHTTGIERGPVCTNPGAFQPLVPVQRKLTAGAPATAGGDSAR